MSPEPRIQNWMKRLVGFFLVLVLYITFSGNLLAAVPTPTDPSADGPTPTPTPKSKVDYNLPYPGILPDSPLYFIKAVRDRVFEFFISDPVKKSEYYLLLSDKRLNTGLFLLDKGKTDQAVSTIEKGEKYLEKSLAEFDKSKAAGKDVAPVLAKLSLAVLKHEEVLNEILEKVPDSAKPGIRNALEKSQKGVERIKQLQEEKLEKIQPASPSQGGPQKNTEASPSSSKGK